MLGIPLIQPVRPRKELLPKLHKGIAPFFWNTHHGYDGQNFLLAAGQLSMKQKRDLAATAYF